MISVDGRLEMIGDPDEDLAILLDAFDDELKTIEAARRSAADEFARQLTVNAADRQVAKDRHVVKIAHRQQLVAKRAQLLASGAADNARKLQFEHWRAIYLTQPLNGKKKPNARLERANAYLKVETPANEDTAAAALARYRDALAGQLIRCQAQLTKMQSPAPPAAAD